MDRSIIAADTFPHVAHLDASRSTIETDYMLDQSMFGPQMLSYSLPFDYSAPEHSAYSTIADTFSTFYGPTTRQPLYGPSAYPDPRSVVPFESVASRATERCNSPVVKAEDISPENPGHQFQDTSPRILESADKCNQSQSATDVDTLMRAIQYKSGSSSGRSRGSLSSQPSHRAYALDRQPRFKARRAGFEYGGFRARRKYQCHVPACDKVFYQKTHLEIHVRSHTGHKPFVSAN